MNLIYKEIDGIEIVNVEEQPVKYNATQFQELANQVSELNETFEIVKELTKEQGTHIDNIVEQIEHNVSFVQSGSNQLEEALEYNNSIVKKKGIISGLGLIAIGIPLSCIIGFPIGKAIVLTGLTGIAIYTKIKTDL